MNKRLTVPNILSKKGKDKIVMLTCYTAQMAKILDCHVDILLVGDSLGMTIYGHKDTLSVSTRMMIDHGQCVVNNTSKALDTIYLSDWSNSYSSFKTALAQRFGEEYDRSFYLSKKSKLGYSKINHIGSQEKKLKWNRLENQSDIVRVILEKPLKIDELYKLNLVYLIKIPDSKDVKLTSEQNKVSTIINNTIHINIIA